MELPEYFPRGYSYLCLKDTIRIKEVNNEINAKDWILKFREACIVWRKRTTYTVSKLTRNQLYRGDFRCQHGTQREPKKRYRTKNTNCSAVLLITVMRTRREVWAINDTLDSEWPCIVKLKGTHNHKLTGAEVLRYQQISEKTKKEMVELFEKGHSATSAYHTFCMMKMAEYSEKYHLVSVDRRLVPTRADFCRMWEKQFRDKFEEKGGESMMETLLLRLQDLLQFGYVGKISFVDGHYSVALCTPVMQRAHYIPQAKETMFVDKTENVGVQNCRIYFFLIHSVAGGIPIGCVITDSAEKEVFETAVKSLIQCFPEYKFDREEGPSVILTDDNVSEQQILKKFWPASTFLLCTSHVLKSCWRWLVDNSHGVHKNDRRTFFTMFKNILYARTVAEYKEKKLALQNTVQHTEFRKYVENMCIRGKEWAVCYRTDIVTPGNESSNFAEIAFRLFKSKPLEKTRTFNLPQLLDFISVCFERYYQQRILDTIHGKLTSSALQKSFVQVQENEIDINIEQITSSSFRVESFTQKDKTYKVDMTVGVCECVEGSNGKLCKHQVAVIKKYILNSANMMDTEMKKLLYEIATGSKPGADQFTSLKDDVNASNSNNEVPEIVVGALSNIQTVVPETVTLLNISSVAPEAELGILPNSNVASETVTLLTISTISSETGVLPNSGVGSEAELAVLLNSSSATSETELAALSNSTVVHEVDTLSNNCSNVAEMELDALLQQSISEWQGNQVIVCGETVHVENNLLRDLVPFEENKEDQVEPYLHQLDIITERIKAEVKADPRNFLPVLKEMLKGYDKLSTTSENLLVGLSLAFNCGTEETTRVNPEFFIQPGTVGSQLNGESCTLGKKPDQIVWTDTTKVDHAYLGMDHVPSKKKKI